MTKPAHYTVHHPELRATYEAMRELGLAESLLSISTIQPLACHLSEPDGSLETDFVPELECLLRCIGMPFKSLPGAALPTIVIESQGVGFDWGNGSTESPLRPAGGWRQRSTGTVDQVHLAALACSDAYWNVMPERLKKSSALDEWVPELFRCSFVWNIPHERMYLCERIWAVWSSSWALEARGSLAMHRVLRSVDAEESVGYLRKAENQAWYLGFRHCDHGFGNSLFADELVLDESWRRGVRDRHMELCDDSVDEAEHEAASA
jgi:hypothetical protein